MGGRRDRLFPVRGAGPGTTGRQPRPLIGPLLLIVGAVHVALTPRLFPASVRSILEGGVLGSVEADPEVTDLRALGFWYATAGVGLLALGWSVTEREQHRGPPPRGLAPMLAGLGVWGVALMPASPFWAFLALAAVTEVRRRQLAEAGP